MGVFCFNAFHSKHFSSQNKERLVFFLNERETEAPLVSVELLDLLAQLEPVDLLAPLATMELRCVISRARKQ